MTYYNSIIVTHQARLRCILHDIINSHTNKAIVGEKGNVHRFQNGCIIHLEITTNNLRLSLMYNGEIDEEKPNYIYYVQPGTIDKKSEEGKYQIVELPSITTTHDFHLHDNSVYNFYLIRHGQATHNLDKWKGKLFNRPIDSDLTLDGIEQAKMTGQQMRHLSINYFFVSDLKRTMQTLDNVAQHAGIKIEKAVILPCNHEVAYTGSGCDGSQKITPNENKNSCSPISNVGSSCTKVGFPLEWDEYMTFYKGTRTKPGMNRQHCRKYNTLQLAMNYIIKSPMQFLSTSSKIIGGVKQKRSRKTSRPRKWSRKYKNSINCKKPKGFSQKQYCKYGRNKNRRQTKKK